MQEFLNDRGLPLQLRLDCLDVMAFIRPAARILVHLDEQAEKVCAALINSGVAISVARGVKRQPKSKIVTVHDWFDESEPSHEFTDMAVLYIAKDQSTADSARSADETKDDVIFGRALGYPNCCVEWIRHRGRVPEIGECLKLYAPNSVYDPLMWPAAMLNDAPLTPHYPCSPSCVQSQTLAQARLKLLAELGCWEILQAIIRARDLVYFVDIEGKLRSVPAAAFVVNASERFAKPSMPAANRLVIAR
jgi:hypothetical protein